ncbi:MAG: hypothetical protein EHM58_08480 [Ignavibacteriae bacterium]|nr:MAG: hypothetical protein EHM58_08480 [Ignavibacteriota bacterium]
MMNYLISNCGLPIADWKVERLNHTSLSPACGRQANFHLGKSQKVYNLKTSNSSGRKIKCRVII